MNKTQKEIIYDHLLKKGHISTMECFKKYNITDLQHAIYELRKEGIEIKDKWLKPKRKHANKFKIYYLER